MAAVPGVTQADPRPGSSRRAAPGLQARPRPERPGGSINERVCEGCGASRREVTASVEPVETEFGRKTRINQTSCTRTTLLKGITVPHRHSRQGRRVRGGLTAGMPADLPEPARHPGEDACGCGWSGSAAPASSRVSQVLGMAALLDGRHASGLDQTKLSQKAGPVVSDVRVTAALAEDAVTVPAPPPTLLGLDLLGAAGAAKLRVADPERAVAIVSEPGADWAHGRRWSAPRPDPAAARAAIEAATWAGAPSTSTPSCSARSCSATPRRPT
ncbi:MAG: hypothetical protein U0R71_01690 [Solirubrobacterales bacterium]